MRFECGTRLTCLIVQPAGQRPASRHTWDHRWIRAPPLTSVGSLRPTHGANQGAPPPGPPRGKEVTIHGVSVRATRNPKLTLRMPVTYLWRLADRRFLGLSTQEPPRNTRRPQFPLVQALPSLGAPL